MDKVLKYKKWFKPKLLFVIILPVLLYIQDLILVFREALYSDLSTHILLIPFIIFYLLYRYRDLIYASISFTNINYSNYYYKDIVGLLILLIGFTMRLYGSYSFKTLEIRMISFIIFIVGMIILFFNFSSLRILLIPLVFLIFLIPPSIEQIQRFASFLSVFASNESYKILKLLNFPVILSKSFGSPIIQLQINAEILTFVIDIACSGIYSFMGFSIFALLIALISNGSKIKKLGILAIGFPILVFLNIIRITLTIIIGYYFGLNLAVNIFHLLGGWVLIFIGTIIILNLTEKILKINIFNVSSNKCIHKDTTFDGSCKNCGRIIEVPEIHANRTDFYKIFFISVLVLISFFFQTPVTTLSEGAPEVFDPQNSRENNYIEILPEIEDYDLRFVYRDQEFEEISGQNASLMFIYQSESLEPHSIWVGIEVGATKGCLHPWELCLITYPQLNDQDAEIIQLNLEDILLRENPPLPARYFTFKEEDTNLTQVILYWYTRAVFNSNEGLRYNWVKTSLIVYSENGEYYPIIEEQLRPFGELIAFHWQPLTNWSETTLILVSNARPVLLFTIFLLLASIFGSLYLENNKTIKANIVYEKISNLEERKIIDTIDKIGVATESDIFEQIRTNSENISEETLSATLLKAERAGLLERMVSNVDEFPCLTWKSNLKFNNLIKRMK